MDSKMIIGFDIGGTKCSVILATCEGNIVNRITGATELAEGALATVNRLIADARLLMEKHSLGKTDVLGVGICCGGPLDRQKGIVLGPPNLPGWDYVPITDLAHELLGLPAYLENDADAIALAELNFGAGRGKSNIVSFTWGTGVGSGIIIGGRLFSGTNGNAGEIGHTVYVPDGRLCGCGKRGCIEAYASGSSIGRMARELVKEGQVSILANYEPLDTAAVCDAARKGDELACNVLHVATQAMGRAISIAAHTLNPEIIILGTMAVKAGDLLMPQVMRVVEDEVWECIRKDLIVQPSCLGDKVQDLAAISALLGRL
jgi:glucokinase